MADFVHCARFDGGCVRWTFSFGLDPTACIFLADCFRAVFVN